MSTSNILQDIVNKGLTQLHVGKIDKRKVNGTMVQNKVRCGILIDGAFVTVESVTNDSTAYLDGKTILQASLDCKSMTGRYLLQGHNAGNAMSQYGMVLVPEGVVKLNLDVAADYLRLVTA